MVGAMLPDLNRLQLIVHPYVIESLLGTPFSWFGFHTLGGVILTSLIGAMLVGSDHRKYVFGLLLLGAVSHLVLDSFLHLPSGVLPPLWWPLTDRRFTTHGLYMSYHRLPVLLVGASAVIVWYMNRRFESGVDS